MPSRSCYVLVMKRDVVIANVPFVPIHHHDGRTVRGGGLFVFARRTGETRVILHMELASAINLRAGPGHPRWEWALQNGLNELLVCLASIPMEIGEVDGDVVWHEDAEFWPADGGEPGAAACEASEELAPGLPETAPARMTQAR
jgi:hypothetical protein